jgi:predicted  nucleic acid-binding Zn-ribbon protein
MIKQDQMGEGHASSSRPDIATLCADVRRLKLELAQLRSDLIELHDALIERMRDTETRLLRSCYSLSESSRECLNRSQQESAPLRERLSSLETHIPEIERRLDPAR